MTAVEATATTAATTTTIWTNNSGPATIYFQVLWKARRGLVTGNGNGRSECAPARLLFGWLRVRTARRRAGTREVPERHA